MHQSIGAEILIRQELPIFARIYAGKEGRKVTIQVKKNPLPLGRVERMKIIKRKSAIRC